MDGCFLVNSAGLQFVFIMNEHKEARETRCTHESTDLCLHKKGNDLQAGKGRSLQDAEEKETLEGNGRRLRNGSLNHFLSLPACLLRLPKCLRGKEISKFGYYWSRQGKSERGTHFRYDR